MRIMLSNDEDDMVDIIFPYTPNIYSGLKIMSKFQRDTNTLSLYTNSDGFSKLIGHIIRKNARTVEFEPFYDPFDKGRKKYCENCNLWKHSEITAPYLIRRCTYINNESGILMTRPEHHCKNWKEKADES